MGSWSCTSGSTGEPFRFLLPPDSECIEEFVRIRALSSGKGYVHEFGLPVVSLRSYCPKAGEPPWRYDPGRNAWYLSPYHINPSTLDTYVKIIEKSNTAVLRGYPSSLYLFTILLEKYGIRLPCIKVIQTSSEVLLPVFRKKLEEYWGIPVLDLYGQNERTVIVHQCWAGHYHNNDDYGVLEIDSEGRMIATSLNNYVMPFIRYDTGDRAIFPSGDVSPDDEPCPCGVSLSIPFQGVMGREDDWLMKPDGTPVPPINVYTAMQYFASVKQFQIRQASDLSLNVLVVPLPGERIDGGCIEAIEQELRRRLEVESISVSVVECLDRDERSGKFRPIVSEFRGKPYG